MQTVKCVINLYRLNYQEAVLDVGCGTSHRFLAVPRGDVNVDLDLPEVSIPNYVRADARQLPIRDDSFFMVLLFNVLEHIDDYQVALNEAIRVAYSRVVIRTDKLLNVSNWLTPDHKYITIGIRFVRIPRSLKSCLRVLSATIGRWAIGYGPLKKLLIRSGLLPELEIGRWNYYCYLKIRTDKITNVCGPIEIRWKPGMASTR